MDACLEEGSFAVVVIIDRGGGRTRGRSHNDAPATFTILGAPHRFDSAAPSSDCDVPHVLCTPVLPHGPLCGCGLGGTVRGGGWCDHTTSILVVWQHWRGILAHHLAFQSPWLANLWCAGYGKWYRGVSCYNWIQTREVFFQRQHEKWNNEKWEFMED